MSLFPSRPAGYRLTVAALSFGQLIGWAALYYTFTVFVLPMQTSLGWTPPEMMGAYTLGLTTWGLSSFVVGLAIDRGHGRRVMAGGAALAGVGFLLWSQVSALWMLYLAWGLLGVAMAACLYEAAFSVVTRRYPAHYPHAITSLTLVGGLASTLSFPVVGMLIGGVGWRWALALIGLAMLLVVAPIQAWALRSPPPPKEATPVAAAAAEGATVGEALRHRAFWLLTLAFLLYWFISAGLWAHIVPALAGKGLDERTALAVLMWVGPAQVFGRLVYLAFARWMPPRRMGLVVMAGLPLSMALLAAGRGEATLIGFAVLFGVVNGMSTIVRGHVVPDYFGRRQVGRISGAMSTMILVPRSISPLLMAWVLTATGGYEAVLWSMFAMGVVSWIAYAAAGSPTRRRS